MRLNAFVGLGRTAQLVVVCLFALLSFSVAAENKGYYYHNDHLGTPLMLTDKDQNVVWQASYDPFCNATVEVELVEQPFRLPGQYYDKETGYLYSDTRYYDSELGTYTQSDTIGLGGGLNTYAYVGGNPIRYIDPTGEHAQCIVWPIGTASCAVAAAGIAWRTLRASNALSAALAIAQNENANDNTSRDDIRECESGRGSPSPGDPDDDPGCIDRLMGQGYSYFQASLICRGPTNESLGDSRDPAINQRIKDAAESAQDKNSRTRDVIDAIVQGIFGGGP